MTINCILQVLHNIVNFMVYNTFLKYTFLYICVISYKEEDINIPENHYIL